MLEHAWIEALHARSVPPITWPDAQRLICAGGLPPHRPMVKGPKVLKMPARRPKVDDAAVLAALQALGATSAAGLALALDVATATACRHLQSLQRAGAVSFVCRKAGRAVGYVWSVA